MDFALNDLPRCASTRNSQWHATLDIRRHVAMIPDPIVGNPYIMPKRPNTPQNDTRRVLDSIRQIVKVLRVASRDSEKRVGISGAQLFVLHKLAEGGVLSVNELADRTHTHQSSVSVVVHRLAERGMVDVERSAADARQAQIRVTPAGKSVLRTAPAAAQDRLITALKHLARKDVRQLADSLELLLKEIGIDGETAAPMLFEDESPRPGRSPKRK